MFLPRLLIYLQRLSLKLFHLLVPVLVELVELLQVRLLNLCFLRHMPLPDLILQFLLKLSLQLVQLLLGKVSLNILPTLLATLLVLIENLAK